MIMNDKDKKTTNEKPVKFSLDFLDVLKGLLVTKPPDKEKDKKADSSKSSK